MTVCDSLHDARGSSSGEHDRMLRTAVVGRQSELAGLVDLLADRAARLVTLRGPGGAGKSRLALQVLHRLRSVGTLAVNLARCDGDADLRLALHDALGLPSPPPGTWPEELAGTLAGDELLVLLDNCDLVRGPVARVVTTLLEGCPHLRLLVTSRTRLGLETERVVDLPGLELPPSRTVDPAALGDVDSVRLFVQRAGTARPGFELGRDNAADVAEVCRLTDGLPLALEIAAARVKLFEPQLVARHLRETLDMLCGRAGDTGSRFTCLRHCVTSSADALSGEERDVLTKLAVFPSDFDLEAAGAVLGVPGSRLPVVLEALAEASLLTVRPSRVQDSPSNRFSMLRTTRLWGLQRLGAGVRAELQGRHACHYQALVGRCAGEGRHLCPDVLDEELGNLRAALHLLVSMGKLDQAAEMGITLSWYWLTADSPERGPAYMHALLSDGLPADFRERILSGGRHLARLPVTPAEPAGRSTGGTAAQGTAHGPWPGGQARERQDVPLKSLTRREAEVAALVAQGLTNRAISRTLGIAEWTAVNHVRNIMRKLNCTSRVSIASQVSLGNALVGRDGFGIGPAG